MRAATSDACIELLDGAGLRKPVLDRLTAAAQSHLDRRAAGAFRIGLITFSNRYGPFDRFPYSRTTTERLGEFHLNGTLYGVSVGPGDPELMTLKAVKTIEACPGHRHAADCGRENPGAGHRRRRGGPARKGNPDAPVPHDPGPSETPGKPPGQCRRHRRRLRAGRDVAMLNLG